MSTDQKRCWFSWKKRVKPSRFAIAIDNIAAQPDARDPSALVALVDRIRPRQASNGEQATHSITELIEVLKQDPARAAVVRGALLALTTGRQHRYFYTDTGVVSAEGLRRGTLSRLSAKFLPQAPHDSYLRDLMKQVFRRPTDYIWLQAVPLEIWASLWSLLQSQPVAETAAIAVSADSVVVRGPARVMAASADQTDTAVLEDVAPDLVSDSASNQAPTPGPAAHWVMEIGEALNILAVRLYAAATNNEVVRLHNDVAYDLSAFDRLNDRARAFRDALRIGDDDALVARHVALSTSIGDCEKELVQWRKLLRKRGTTTSLSQQMLADGQMLARLRALTQITAPQPTAERQARALRLFRKLIEEQGRDSSVLDLWRRTNRMLAQQVTEHAGLIGEHYVAVTRSAWFGMVRAASGAGLVVAVMALVKQMIAAMQLPPLWNALAISINYAAGFVIVHLLHLAIATKQPAMTAALIASTVQSSPSGKRSLTKLAGLIVAIVRTQFIAIVCNVATALPMGALLHLMMAHFFGPDWLTTPRAEHLLADIDPIHSLALPHAAFAGVCLYLSGVLAGYYNNLSAVTQVPERLKRARWLSWVGANRRERFANYVRDNLGSLVGNASLGFMLGMAGFVGFLTGLPIDVRHVTLSASNFGLGISALDWGIDWHEALLLSAGILLIGFTNLAVSFSLALWTAFSANGIRMRDGSRLWILIWRKLRRRPGSLLLP